MRCGPLVGGGTAREFATDRLDEIMPLRRAGNPVGPVQPRVEPLRAVRCRHLVREHEAGFVEERPRVGFGREILALPTPIRPATRQPAKDLAAIALADNRLVRTRGHAALQPLRHAFLGDFHVVCGHATAAEILLRQDIDRDLRPTLRYVNVVHLENHGTVRVHDLRGTRHEREGGERVRPLLGKSTRNLH